MEGAPEAATGMASGQGTQKGGQLTPGMGQEATAAQGMARQRSDIICREWTEPGCFRGASCQFAHPVGRGRALPANKDCNFWLSGYCRYSAATCSKGQHVPHKLRSRPRRPRASQDSNIVQGTGNLQGSNTVQASNILQGNQLQSPDFLRSLVTAVNQAVAGAPGSLQTTLQTGQSGLQGGLASQ